MQQIERALEMMSIYRSAIASPVTKVNHRDIARVSEMTLT